MGRGRFYPQGLSTLVNFPSC
ncbi:hypothetical protein GQ607_003996 [Colletotrichum asianum]|uniref:Uncharacterized protein n=1 Tax=Colletotrichum asianum TaxID=702518 RepID=A0A8H3ZQE1_9PEZI|nr:hypothetical protein GQ607_003996 [Colletotrichum asianum]